MTLPIVERLRTFYGMHRSGPASDLMQDAADTIEKLVEGFEEAVRHYCLHAPITSDSGNAEAENFTNVRRWQAILAKIGGAS